MTTRNPRFPAANGRAHLAHAPDPMAVSGANAPRLLEEPISVLHVGAMSLIATCLSGLLRGAGQNLRIESIERFADDFAGYTPDVILFSAKMDSISDPEVRSELAPLANLFPNTPIFVISERDDPREAVAAIDLGLRGYFPTSLGAGLLIAAIRLVAAGGTFLPPQHLHDCVAQLSQR